MYKLCLAAAISFSVLASSQVNAITLNDDFEVVTNLGIYSEYNLRGLSFTQRKPAVQGTVTLAHSSGAYVGLFASQVDLEIAETDYEADYFAGYFYPFNDHTNLDVGYAKYTYPDSSFLNLSETYAVFKSYGAKAGVYYTSDGGADADQAFMYSYIGYENNELLPYGIGLDTHIGQYDFKDPSFFDENGKSKEKYIEWEIGFNKNFKYVDAFVSYIDTNLSKAECESYLGDKKSCSPRVFVGLSTTF